VIILTNTKEHVVKVGRDVVHTNYGIGVVLSISDCGEFASVGFRYHWGFRRKPRIISVSMSKLSVYTEGYRLDLQYRAYNVVNQDA
jgi:hypothetical protein